MDTTRLSMILQLSNGESEAWQAFDRFYKPMIFKWLCHYDLQISDAEDLSQEVLLVLAQRISEFEHNQRVGAFRSWARVTTVNVARNYLRKHQRAPTAPGTDTFLRMLNQLEDPNSELTLLFNQEHDRMVVERLLNLVADKFEPVTLEIFQCHVLQGEGARATAERFQVSVASVHVAKSRVLRQLRIVAADWMEELSLH